MCAFRYDIYDLSHSQFAALRVNGSGNDFALFDFLEFAETIEPFFPFAGAYFLGECSQDFFGISNNTEVHLDEFVDFGRINVDVDLLCLSCVAGHGPCYSVVKTHSHRDEKITFVCLNVAGQMTVHSKHSLEKREV